MLLLQCQSNDEPLDVGASGTLLNEVTVTNDCLLSASPEHSLPQHSLPAGHCTYKDFVDGDEVCSPWIIDAGEVVRWVGIGLLHPISVEVVAYRFRPRGSTGRVKP